MCDYSLENYRSRPAQKGEQYTTSRFPSGTVGFIDPTAKPDENNAPVAVCMTCDMRMQLDDIPESVQEHCGVGGSEQVTFCRLEGASYTHKDGIRFENGAKITLQRLGPDVRAVVTDDLSGTTPGGSGGSYAHDADEIVRSEREPEPA